MKKPSMPIVRPFHRCRGSIIFEFAISAFFLVILTYVSADVGFMLYGAAFNDRACRDAARAAAQGSSLTDATNRAQAALVAHQTNPAVMQSPALVQPIVYQTYNGTPPPQTSPFVTVTTSTKIKMPFAPLVVLSGLEFDPAGNLTFSQSYTFPIVGNSTSVD